MKPAWSERLIHGFALRAWLLLGRPQRALPLLDRWLAQWPEDAHARASRSHLLAQAGQHEQALLDAQALVAAHPARHAADWFNLAYLLERTARFAQAETAFRRALALDDRLDRAWYGLGLTLVRLQRFDEAVQALERATVLQPMSPFGWYALARVHVDRQSPDEARRIIRHLQGFEPQVAAQLARETGLAA